MANDERAGDANATVSTSQFTHLMEAIQASQDRIEQKFADFRSEVRKSQEDAAAKALKRVKHEKAYTWRKKGHEEQFSFNSRVDETISEAQEELASSGLKDASLDKAAKALERGRELLGERQKLIKIADRSELGWGVVAEYTADELADDSDDEKRLEKAERAAERKAARRKRAKATTLPGKRPRPTGSIPAGPTEMSSSGGGPQPYGTGPRRPPVVASAPKPLGPCFACGEMGHLRHLCPRTVQTPAEMRKWYPSQASCMCMCMLEACECTCTKSVCNNQSVGHKCVCGEQCVAALTQGGERLSLEPGRPCVGEGVKAVDHADKGLITEPHRCRSLLMNCEKAGKVLPFDHSNLTAGNQECEPSLGCCDNGDMASGVTRKDCLETELVAYSEDEEVTVCGFESESEDSIHENPQLRVKGRLRERLQFWKECLQAPTFILDTIETGYVLPLKSEPTPYCRPNQASAIANATFVQQSVEELVDSGCVQSVVDLPYICSPLSVVENSVGKKRLVINLRHLNRFLWKQRFKYEDLRVAMLLFERGDFLFSFDLKSGYHHVEIAKIHTKYLGFSWGGEVIAIRV